MEDKQFRIFIDDPIFRRLHLPYPPQEKAKLKRQIIQEGYTKPFLTWSGVLLADFDAYDICFAESIGVTEKKTSFPKKEIAIDEMCKYELQKNYYEDKVRNNENWELIKIYADEGISGTSLRNRDAFNEMIADSKAGKLDLIITKSVSRFARNIVDCVTIVRELALLKNPVGVFFETENIFTLNDTSEMALNFTATMAQEESHVKSSIMNASIEMRFSHGIVLTPVLLGYDHDENGNLVINEEEALTVRLIN